MILATAVLLPWPAEAATTAPSPDDAAAPAAMAPTYLAIGKELWLRRAGVDRDGDAAFAGVRGEDSRDEHPAAFGQIRTRRRKRSHYMSSRFLTIWLPSCNSEKSGGAVNGDSDD